ncbi:MAG: DUF481 domain-containing protein [Gemmatimonadales bacterium]
MAPAPAHAQAPAPDTVKTLEITADLGFVNTAGNSDVTTFNVGDKLIFRTRDKRNILTQHFALVYGRSEGETVASNWRASGRYERGLNDRLYLYGILGMDRDRLAGISRRFEEGAGVSWKAFALPRSELGFEFGLSLIQQRSLAGIDDNFTAGRLSGAFRHKFTETASFTQAVEFLPNLETSDDYRLNSETAVVAALSRRLSFKVGYVIRFDNLPEPGFEKTDRLLTTGLQVAY